MTYLKPIFVLAIVLALPGCGLTPPGEPDRAGRGAIEAEMLRGVNLGDSADGTLRSQAMYMRSQAAALRRNAEETDALAQKQRALTEDYEKKALEAKADAVKLRKQRNANDVTRLRYESMMRQMAHCEREARATRRMAEHLAYDAKTMRSKANAADREAALLERRAAREERAAEQEAEATGK